MNGSQFLAVTIAALATTTFIQDQVRARRRRHTDDPQWQRIQALMPELLAEMRQDLAGNPTTRLIVVLPSRRMEFNSAQPHFAYFADMHPSIHAQFAILEEIGYLEDVGPLDAQLFWMTEALVQRLLPAR